MENEKWKMENDSSKKTIFHISFFIREFSFFLLDFVLWPFRRGWRKAGRELNQSEVAAFDTIGQPV